MHGTNIIRKQELRDDGTLQIHEIFPTIQGEGPLAGTPAVFVRLTGCNLRCTFCDTEWNDSTDRYMLFEDVFHRILLLRGEIDLVVLTGGEPMRQNIVPLIRMLNDHEIKVQIETAGTVWLDRLPQPNNMFSIVCSPKTPVVNDSIIGWCNDWKYIVRAGEVSLEDGLPIMSTQTQGKDQQLFRPPCGSNIYVQPCDEGPGNESATKANTAEAVRSAMRFGYRLSLQQHKIIGVP